ncbi:MAG TPA: hypothetical protein ENK06_02875 [Gammaproteobacteria bacterium]|nr:hypothetical protein [Gammaproteobacteria bacterium]
MTDTLAHNRKEHTLSPVNNAAWEAPPTDHFGYASEEERRTRRGLEEWEMVGDHLPHQSLPGGRMWVGVTLFAATVTTAALYWYGVDIEPTDKEKWAIDRFREEIFAVIFFFIFLYTSMAIRLILDSQQEGKKRAEKRIIAGVLAGILFAVVLGIAQVFLGYLF